jgi:hypothetical protein
MADEIKTTCPVCDFEVGTKEDGTKIKAHRVSGEKCEGSDRDIVTVSGVDAGETFEDAPESDTTPAQGDDESDDEGNLNDDSTEPESAAQVFTFRTTVHESCPYLSDKVWHHENVKAAQRAAIAAGHVPAGEEAKYAGMNHFGGDRLELIYTVPVK